MSQKQINQFERMTQAPVGRLILSLSVPTVLSMLITNIYNLVDTAFVGRLGTSASGAVGIVFGFMSILQAGGFLFGQGSGSLLARALGAQDEEKASVYASTGFFGSFLFGLLLTLLGFLNLDWIVTFLGSTPTIAPYAKTYISFILAAAPFMTSSLTMNNILRYEGRAVLGTTALMIGAVLNMIGDPIFMFGLHMGIAGAGLSTALSQFISFCLLLACFLTGRTQSRISPKRVRLLTLSVSGSIISTGLPSLIRQALNAISSIVLNSHAAIYGDSAVAAMSIVSRVFFFVLSITLGICQGFQPVSAYNYGAGKYSRVRKAFFFTVRLTVALMAAACVVVFALSPVIVRLFIDSEEVISIATRALRLQMLAGITVPPCMAAEMTYQTTGKSLGAALLSSLRSGLFFIPIIPVMSRLRGLSGIEEAQPLAFVLTLPVGLFAAWRYFRDLPKKDRI